MGGEFDTANVVYLRSPCHSPGASWFGTLEQGRQVQPFNLQYLHDTIEAPVKHRRRRRGAARRDRRGALVLISDSLFLNPDIQHFIHSDFYWTLIRPATSASEVTTFSVIFIIIISVWATNFYRKDLPSFTSNLHQIRTNIKPPSVVKRFVLDFRNPFKFRNVNSFLLIIFIHHQYFQLEKRALDHVTYQ